MKNLRDYLLVRKQHLDIEKDQIKFKNHSDKKRKEIESKLSGRIAELGLTIKRLDKNIKEAKEYEQSKVKHLKLKKAYTIRGLI